MGYGRHKQPVYVGDRVKIRTIRGVKGNIIGRMPDGRTIIFDQHSPYYNMLGPGQLVECKVTRVSQRYVLVDPISEPEFFEGEGKPISKTEIDKARLLENLRILSEEGRWETAIIAGALMHMIEKLDASREPPPRRSSQNTDDTAEEHPDERSSDSTLSNEFIKATSSSGLTQPYVRKHQAPKS